MSLKFKSISLCRLIFFSEIHFYISLCSCISQTAFAVTDAILHLDGLTRVVVTHRLDEALMSQYDEIIVMRNGKIQERGSFGQLMEQKGIFYSLCTLAA